MVLRKHLSLLRNKQAVKGGGLGVTGASLLSSAALKWHLRAASDLHIRRKALSPPELIQSQSTGGGGQVQASERTYKTFDSQRSGRCGGR